MTLSEANRLNDYFSGKFVRANAPGKRKRWARRVVRIRTRIATLLKQEAKP